MDDNKNKFESNKKYFTISVYTVFVVLLCTFGIKSIVNWAETKNAIHSLFNKLSPFLIGVFIAYLIHPLVKKLELRFYHDICHIRSQKICRSLGIFSAYLLLLLFLFLFSLYIIPDLERSIQGLLGSFGEISATVTKWTQDLEIWVEELNPNINVTFINNIIDQVIPPLLSYLKSALNEALPAFYQVSVAVLQWIFNLLIAFIISCYVLSDRHLLGKNAKRLLYSVVPPKSAHNFLITVRECDHIFGGYIIGKVIDSLIIGLICFIAMSIFDLPFRSLISVIVGITNMIPYFGPFIGAVPGTLILLFISPRKAIVFLVIIFIIQQFDGWVLGPKILGSSTGLRPLWIIFAIILGGYVAGPIGMFLGVPVVAVISYLMEIWIKKRLKRYAGTEKENLAADILASDLEDEKKDAL